LKTVLLAQMCFQHFNLVLIDSLTFNKDSDQRMQWSREIFFSSISKHSRLNEFPC
jgi:hypothetical protein